jgi:glucose-6-phosphate-specific signal transduction histidine kinase
MIPSRCSLQVVGSRREWVERLGCRASTGAAAGGGLRGLADRIDAFGGRLEIDSPPAGGTRIIATLPP